MDVIECIKKDKAYLKCKLIVKSWEKEFKSKHSRTPSKFDIKEASAKIKYAYKKYFQLKSEALENSLSVCDIEDDLSPEPVRHFGGLSMECLSSEMDLLPSLPSGSQVKKLLEQTHMTKTDVKDKPSISPLSDNLSKKLFQNRRFSIRNPRKLANLKRQSTSDTQLSSLTDDNCKEEINNTINDSEKSSEKTFSDDKVFGSIGNLMDFKKDIPIRQFNESWLERATGVTVNSEHKINNSSFGMTNIILKPEGKIPEYVDNSESDGEDISLNKIKPALKKRKLTNNLHVNANRHSNSILDNTQPGIEHQESSTNAINYITTNQCKKSKKSTAKKLNTDIINQKPPEITDYLPFKLENDIAPRHANVSDLLETVGLPNEHGKNQKKSDNDDKISEKIKNGTINDNFVKINIEKKKFARHHKGINYSRYKKQQWKDKKALHGGMEFPDSGKISCFKCGATGHMARYCTAQRGDNLLPLESYDDNDIPTLEDIENIVSQEYNKITLPESLSQVAITSSQIPESFLKMLANDEGTKEVKPIFTNYKSETPKELINALKQFGHDEFRAGQEETMMRILCGMSTLLILSTGGGKSLCYQLPAYIYANHYKCITLVVSPLVSLMEDQVFGMPDFLKAGCLHTNQSPTVRSKMIKCLKDGEINILLISPEALISGDSSNGFTGLFKTLPPIAFACIDEAHCVSQWSHNFRPSYLMLCRVLREKLGIKCILGLTATASQATVKSIINHIDIPDGQTGVIKSPTLPDNLHLSVSFEKDKDRALVSYLTSERLCNFNSIIVYCIRRDECERVAAVLRSCLQEPGKKNMEEKSNKRKRMSYISEAYHAGMSAAQRKKIQKYFMDGTLKIIVATVAFGMGINKSNIRCIIHYNMPSSFESYVQEVGRAGRDGEAAYCHVFMSYNNKDKSELLKHIHANSIDRPTIRKLLQKVFIPCKCLESNHDQKAQTSSLRCKGHEVGIPIDQTVEELDLPSENIATLLCYIELHEKKYIKVLNNAYTICKISSYGGPQKILEATKTCPPLAMAYLIESKKNTEITKKCTIEFQVIEVAAAIGWESGITKYHLKNLEWFTENGISKRSQLKVEFNTLGFRIKTPGDLSAAELDQVLDDLHEIVMIQEKTMLYQLEESLKAFTKFGNNSVQECNKSEGVLQEKSAELKNIIRNYFQREVHLPENIVLEKPPIDNERVVSDTRALITSYKDCIFTGRSIAKIFQGISSPNFPAIVWGRCKFWRSHINEDFYDLMKIATEQIIHMKIKY